MAVSFTCADLGLPCPATFITYTVEELYSHVALHANQAHPTLRITPEVMVAVQAAVRQR